MQHPSHGASGGSPRESGLSEPETPFPGWLRFSTLLLAVALCLGYLALSAALTDDLEPAEAVRSAGR
jgi:hypothetical protein